VVEGGRLAVGLQDLLAQLGLLRGEEHAAPGVRAGYHPAEPVAQDAGAVHQHHRDHR
jgi:hypothetical protein